MYFNKTVLTLMAISLYLIPRAELAVQPKGGTTKVEMQSEVNSSYQRAEQADQSEEASEEQLSADTSSLDQTQSANEIIEFQNDNANISRMILDAHQTDQLFVVYYVYNNGIYDTMFKDLARKHTATKFVKVNTNTQNDGHEEVETTSVQSLEIYFYKFGLFVGSCLSDNKLDIDAQIEKLKMLQKSQIKHEGVDEENDEPNKEVTIVNGIYRPVDENDLDTIYHSGGENNASYCLTYAVQTDAYDYMFTRLANEHPNTKFLKIDTNTFRTRKDEIINLGNELILIVVQRRSLATEVFSSTDFKYINERLTYYEQMTPKEFEKVTKDEHLRRNLLQYEYAEFLYKAKYEKELESIYSIAYDWEKYSLTYYVNNTKDFDQMFKELADEHIETIFIRINVDEYTLKNGGKTTIEKEPFIVLVKFDFIIETFTLTKKEDIKEKLNYYENLTEEEFNDLVADQREEKKQSKKRKSDKNSTDYDDEETEIQEEDQSKDEAKRRLKQEVEDYGDDLKTKRKEKNQELEDSDDTERETEGHPVDEDSDYESEAEKDD